MSAFFHISLNILISLFLIVFIGGVFGMIFMRRMVNSKSRTVRTLALGLYVAYWRKADIKRPFGLVSAIYEYAMCLAYCPLAMLAYQAGWNLVGTFLLFSIGVTFARDVRYSLFPGRVILDTDWQALERAERRLQDLRTGH